MNIERVPLKIDTYLDQAKNHISQQKWELAIVACQRVIALCQGQISAATQYLTPESLLLCKLNLNDANNHLRCCKYFRVGVFPP
ncbi:MAG: hypothetical protein Kow0049_33960 [Stanieria sp.]